MHLQTTIDIKESELLENILTNSKYLINVYGKEHFIGVSCPGMVDAYSRTLIKIPNMPNISNFSIGEAVEHALKLPVLIANDANAEAVGEKYFGEGNVRDFVLLHMGYGIGAGIVLNNKLYEGNFGVLGEIGHVSADYSEVKKCDCGNYGCVELYVGATKLIRECANIIPEIKSIEDVKTYSASDERIKQVIYKLGELMGNVLVSVVNILAPQKIIVSGPQSILGDFLITPIKKIIDKRSFYSVGKNITIVQSKLMENEGMMGAMTIVLDSFLNNPHRFIAL